MVIKRPYPPSWVDRFQGWLYRLPIPIWLSVLLIYLLAVLSFHVALWLDGAVPFGALDGESVFNGVWAILGISFLLALNSLANRAIDKFSVLIPRKNVELENLRYQMTTVPARFALGLTVLIAIVMMAAAYFDPTFLGVSAPVSIALFLFFVIFSYSFAPIMLYQGFRQLVLVTQAYRLVNEINLFRLQPLYAFAGLTMTSSLFWILVLNLNFLGNASETSTADFLLSMIFNAPFVALAFVTFIVPLWGIHRRIQNRKEQALAENGLQIERAHQTLYRNLNRNDYKKGSDIEKSLASLYKMREQIEKIPTWPWNPGTFRNFLSAVFLPMGLWLTQRYLAGLF